MSILLVGGSGFLGSCVARLLSVEQIPTVVVDDLLYIPRHRTLPDVSFVRGRVESFDFDALAKEHNFTAVIWLAAIVGDAACMIDPTTSLRVNTEAVRWLSTFNGRVVFPSTCSVYGAQEALATEESSLNPLSLYAMSKIAAEKHLERHPQAWIFRLGTLHGVSDRMRFDLMVNTMTRDAWQTGRVKVFGGAQRRPLLSVLDAAQLFMDAAVRAVVPPGVYNAATENLTAADVGDIVARTADVRVDSQDMPFEDRRDYAVDCSKLFGRARKSFWDDGEHWVEDSVKDILKLLRSGRLRDPNEAEYHNANVLRI